MDAGETVGPHAVPFVNRLSDLLWLLGRVVEHAAGVDARMRRPDEPGPRWSRAWSGDPES
jgi:cob(I)alamin adenosyltransferase